MGGRALGGALQEKAFKLVGSLSSAYLGPKSLDLNCPAKALN